MAKKFCLVATDAISFNVLYRGQLEYLIENEFDLTLICGGSHLELEILRERNVGRVIDFGMIRKPSLWLDLLCLMRLFWHFLFNRYDLVVSTTPKALLLGSLAVFMTHQSRRVSFFQGRVYENFKGFKRKFYIFLDRIVIACSQEIVFVSQSLMDEFLKDIPSTYKKGKIIGSGSGNGVCPDRFFPELRYQDKVSHLRNTLGFYENDFVVLSVGRICNDKGLVEIAKVANTVSVKTPNVRFLMLGSIEDNKSFEQLSQLIKVGVVTHIDFVSDIAPYLALTDVHLFLSHREGFGNVAIEAAVMNVPTIAFDVVGVKDSVAEGISGLRFKLGDSESVARVILSFARDPEKMREQFKSSREWAIKNFSKTEVWENYKSFYIGVNN